MLNTEIREKKRSQGIYLLIGFLFFLMLRIPMWFAPLTRDEGLFGMIAQQCIKGHLPCTTLMENKPPLIFYTYALPLMLTQPNNHIAIRCFATLLFLLGAVFLYFIAKKISGERGAQFSFFLYCISSLGVVIEGYVASSEMLMCVPLLISIFFYLRGEKRHLFASGFFLAAACLIRQTALIFLLMVVFHSVLISIRKKKPLWQDLACLFSGFLILPALFVIIYAIHGELKNLYFGSIVYGFFVGGGIKDKNFLQLLISFYENYGHALLENPLLFVSPLISFPFFLVHFREFDRKVLVALVFIASLIVTFSIRVPCPKNMFQILPFLCLLSAWGFDKIFHLANRTGRTVSFTLIALLLCFFLFNISPFYFGVNDRALLIKVMPEHFIYAEEVGTGLKDKTQEGDAVLNWGVEWEMSFFTLRDNPMKHQLLFLLYLSWKNSGGGSFLREDFISFQTEILKNISSHPPEFIVVTAPFFTYDRDVYFLPVRVEEIIKRDYRFLGTYRGYGIYRLVKRQARKIPGGSD